MVFVLKWLLRQKLKKKQKQNIRYLIHTEYSEYQNINAIIFNPPPNSLPFFSQSPQSWYIGTWCNVHAVRWLHHT